MQVVECDVRQGLCDADRMDVRGRDAQRKAGRIRNGDARQEGAIDVERLHRRRAGAVREVVASNRHRIRDGGDGGVTRHRERDDHGGVVLEDIRRGDAADSGAAARRVPATQIDEGDIVGIGAEAHTLGKLQLSAEP